MAYHDFTEVSDDQEVFSTQGAYLTDTCHKMHLGIAREGAQHLTFGQVEAADGYVADGLLGEHVGLETDAHTLGNDLDIVDMCQLTVNGQRIAEVDVVECLGIDSTNAVELFFRGIDLYAVGHIVYM